MPTERRSVFFAGRVQGVGFRFTTQRLAMSHSILGSVRNLPDGRVELVMEGEASKLDSFVEAIRAALGSKIQSVSSERTEITLPSFTDFSIRE
ncbi:MAG: acylphosphatase [Isosphaeraceae bacterium]